MLINLFTNYTNIIYLVIGLLFVLGVIVILVKFPNGKYYALGLMAIILIASGIFTAIANYEWISARGGIYGAIEDIRNKNTVVQNGLTFDFDKFTLEATGNADEYMARVEIDYVNEADLSNMAIYVNSEPTELVSKSKNYIISKYTYMFQNEDLAEMTVDTLKIRFSFSEKYSECIISTTGGIKNVKLWNKYINKNGFKVEIKTNDYNPDYEIVGKTCTLKVTFELGDGLKSEFAYGVAKFKRVAGGNEKSLGNVAMYDKTYTIKNLSIYGEYTIEFITVNTINSIEPITFTFSESESIKEIVVTMEKAPLTALTFTITSDKFTSVTKSSDEKTYFFDTDKIKLDKYEKAYLDSFIESLADVSTDSPWIKEGGKSFVTINYYGDELKYDGSGGIVVMDWSPLYITSGELPEDFHAYLFSCGSVSTCGLVFYYFPETEEVRFLLMDEPKKAVKIASDELAFKEQKVSNISFQLTLRLS